MQSERGIDLIHAPSWNSTDAISEAFHGHRPNLLGLSLRVTRQTAGSGGEPDLKRMDAANVGCHGYDRDHPAAKCRSTFIRRVVADHHSRSLIGCFRTNRVA